MVPKSKIEEILDGYDTSDITIATLCSHSSLQIFHGARKMGFKTLGLTITHSTKYYDAFPLAKPDEILRYKDFDDFDERTGELLTGTSSSFPTAPSWNTWGPAGSPTWRSPRTGTARS